VHDLGDGAERRIGEREPVEQRLERAAISGMCEFAVEHVEAQFALSRPRLRIDELESRVAIDEPPNQPGARNAIDEDPSASSAIARPGASKKSISRTASNRLRSLTRQMDASPPPSTISDRTH